jgi:hypothetical protein
MDDAFEAANVGLEAAVPTGKPIALIVLGVLVALAAVGGIVAFALR